MLFCQCTLIFYYQKHTIMKQLIPAFKLITSLSFLCILAVLLTSMSSSDVIPNSDIVCIDAPTEHFFMDYDLDDCESAPTAVACSSWSLYSRINCGCAPNSPGNSSSTHSFHKRKYARTCWIVGMSQISWSEYSPWICDRVCL